MANAICSGATCQCTFGTTPSTINIIPTSKVFIDNKPCGNIMDSKPMVNIMPFGMCTTLSNPTVASATAAALGVLTPQPCIPNTQGSWMPGSPKVLVGGKPALNNRCKLSCLYGGIISITNPGQAKMQVP